MEVPEDSWVLKVRRDVFPTSVRLEMWLIPPAGTILRTNHGFAQLAPVPLIIVLYFRLSRSVEKTRKNTALCMR